jgi:hypothetical protein
MKKELSPGAYLINALYSIKDEKIPLSLNQKDKKYLWKFTFRATDKIKKEFKKLIMYVDRNSLECALHNERDIGYIKIEDNKLSINDKIDIKEINRCLGPKLRKKLPEIFREVYRGL